MDKVKAILQELASRISHNSHCDLVVYGDREKYPNAWGLECTCGFNQLESDISSLGEENEE